MLNLNFNPSDPESFRKFLVDLKQKLDSQIIKECGAYVIFVPTLERAVRIYVN